MRHLGDISKISGYDVPTVGGFNEGRGLRSA